MIVVSSGVALPIILFISSSTVIFESNQIANFNKSSNYDSDNHSRMVNRELKEKKNTFSFKCKYIIHRDILLGAQTQYTSDTCGMSSIVLYL